MDAKQVETFCDAAARLLPALGAYASTEAGKRTPGDDAPVRLLARGGRRDQHGVDGSPAHGPAPGTADADAANTTAVT